MHRDKMKVLFFVEQSYYMPHFTPIADAIFEIGGSIEFLFANGISSDDLLGLECNFSITENPKKVFSDSFDFVFFANPYKEIASVKSKKVFMDHGVGTKYCDYDRAIKEYDIVLVEGEYRHNSLVSTHSSHKDKIYKVGFSKLDLIYKISEEETRNYKKKYLKDMSKPTLLYAPTFYPSSIERMHIDFPEDIKEYNIIVKPHYFSLGSLKYRRQREKFYAWEKFSNCTVIWDKNISLIPLIAISDIMISDESSAIFEFTAFDKPVVLNRFLHLRWSYKINPKKLRKRLDQGMDVYRKIGDNAYSYEEMLHFIDENINDPEKYSKARQQYTKEVCGLVDGKSSKRIVQVLLSHLEQKSSID